MTVPNRWDPVEVEWLDAHTENGGGNAADHVRTFNECRRFTLGYYLGEKNNYTIVAETDDRKADTPPDDAERFNEIYNPMIVKITSLKRGKTYDPNADDEAE